jgi:integrase
VFPALGNYRLTEVTPSDVLRVIDDVKARGKRKVLESAKSGRSPPKAGGVQAAKQVRTLLKGMFDYAIARQLLTYNPVSVIPRKSVALGTRRERALGHDELKQFVCALNETDDTKAFLVAMKLILLTLVRKGELTKARWEDVDLTKMEWRLPTTKTGEPHLVPLSIQAANLFDELAVLAGDSPWALPGRDAKRSISEHTLNAMLARNSAFGLKNFVIHDLRRTASTMLHERGFAPDVIEKALNLFSDNYICRW